MLTLAQVSLMLLVPISLSVLLADFIINPTAQEEEVKVGNSTFSVTISLKTVSNDSKSNEIGGVGYNSTDLHNTTNKNEIAGIVYINTDLQNKTNKNEIGATVDDSTDLQNTTNKNEIDGIVDDSTDLQNTTNKNEIGGLVYNLTDLQSTTNKNEIGEKFCDSTDPQNTTNKNEIGGLVYNSIDPQNTTNENNHSLQNQNTDTVCSSSACNASAKTILEKMDMGVDPCDNFYNFACGSYIKNTVIQPDRSLEMLYTLMMDKMHDQMKSYLEAPIADDDITPFKAIKKFFHKCTDQNQIELDAINTTKRIISQIGSSWPVFQGHEWDSLGFNVFNTTYKLRENGLPYNNIFSVTVDPSKTASHYILYVNSPQLSMEEDYLIEGFTNKIVTTYYDLIVNISVALGANRKFAMTEFNHSMMFEIQLANLTRNSPKRDALSNVTLQTLVSAIPYIPWVDYINHMICNKNVTVTENYGVYLKQLGYFVNLGDLLENTPKRVQANYLLSRILFDLAPYLNEEILNYKLVYDQATYGVVKKSLRWRECLNNLPNGLLNIAGGVYVRNFFDKNKKITAMEVVEDVKSALVQILKDSNWMDANTSLAAVEKANAMNSSIGYPEDLLDDNVLEEYYKNLTIAKNDTLIDAALKVQKFAEDKDFKNLNQEVNRTFWANHLETTALNARFSQDKNLVYIPAAILQDDSYDNKRPQFTNYGGFGFVVAHEMTHGFDNRGRKYDKDGKETNWWKTETLTEFEQKANCLIQQYENFTVPKTNLHIDGHQTLGENIADNGAIKIAYHAYQLWTKKHGLEKMLPQINYTPNQLFWISAAQYMCMVQTDELLKDTIVVDPHSPMEFRVIGAFSNSNEFAKDFKCPVGSNMHPQSRCQIW